MKMPTPVDLTQSPKAFFLIKVCEVLKKNIVSIFHRFLQVLHTGFQSYFVDWTNSGELLAVAGKLREIAVKSNHTIRYMNVLHFYNDAGLFIYRVRIPCETVSE